MLLATAPCNAFPLAVVTIDPYTYMQLHMRGGRRESLITRQVSELEIGDVFLWAGRSVTLEDQKSARTYAHGRTSRYLIVSEGDELHQLHYYDREVVTWLHSLIPRV